MAKRILTSIYSLYFRWVDSSTWRNGEASYHFGWMWETEHVSLNQGPMQIHAIQAISWSCSWYVAGVFLFFPFCFNFNHTSPSGTYTPPMSPCVLWCTHKMARPMVHGPWSMVWTDAFKNFKQLTFLPSFRPSVVSLHLFISTTWLLGRAIHVWVFFLELL